MNKLKHSVIGLKKKPFTGLNDIILPPDSKVFSPTEQLAYANIFGTFQERSIKQAEHDKKHREIEFRRLSRDVKYNADNRFLPFPEVSPQARDLELWSKRLINSPLFIVAKARVPELHRFVLSKYSLRCKELKMPFREIHKRELLALFWSLDSKANVLEYWTTRAFESYDTNLTQIINSSTFYFLVSFKLKKVDDALNTLFANSREEVDWISAIISAPSLGGLDGLKNVISNLETPWKVFDDFENAQSFSQGLRVLAKHGLTEGLVGPGAGRIALTGQKLSED